MKQHPNLNTSKIQLFGVSALMVVVYKKNPQPINYVIDNHWIGEIFLQYFP